MYVKNHKIKKKSQWNTGWSNTRFICLEANIQPSDVILVCYFSADKRLSRTPRRTQQPKTLNTPEDSTYYNLIHVSHTQKQRQVNDFRCFLPQSFALTALPAFTMCHWFFFFVAMERIITELIWKSMVFNTLDHFWSCLSVHSLFCWLFQSSLQLGCPGYTLCRHICT